MQLPSKVYDVLKKICTIILPAVASLYFGLAQIWGFPYAEQIVGTLSLIETFIGVLIGISTYNYNKTNNEGEVE